MKIDFPKKYSVLILKENRGAHVEIPIECKLALMELLREQDWVRYVLDLGGVISIDFSAAYDYPTDEPAKTLGKLCESVMTPQLDPDVWKDVLITMDMVDAEVGLLRAALEAQQEATNGN